MKLIAIHSIRRREIVKAAEPVDRNNPALGMKPAEHRDADVKPGEAFTVDDEQEASRLMRSGAARAWSEKKDDEKQKPPAGGERPRNAPASGTTEAPDPNRVADRAMAADIEWPEPEGSDPHISDLGDDDDDGKSAKASGRQPTKPATPQRRK